MLLRIALELQEDALVEIVRNENTAIQEDLELSLDIGMEEVH
jgi:hypothetical protein